jgi:hypothetical protein
MTYFGDFLGANATGHLPCFISKFSTIADSCSERVGRRAAEEQSCQSQFLVLKIDTASNSIRSILRSIQRLLQRRLNKIQTSAVANFLKKKNQDAAFAFLPQLGARRAPADAEPREPLRACAFAHTERR